MARPVNTPLFATDATLGVAAGADAGLAPRLDPGVLVRGQGFYPAKLPARFLNYEFGAQGDWIDYLDKRASHNAMQAWDVQNLPVTSSCRSR